MSQPISIDRSALFIVLVFAGLDLGLRQAAFGHLESLALDMAAFSLVYMGITLINQSSCSQKGCATVLENGTAVWRVLLGVVVLVFDISIIKIGYERQSNVLNHLKDTLNDLEKGPVSEKRRYDSTRLNQLFEFGNKSLFLSLSEKYRDGKKSHRIRFLNVLKETVKSQDAKNYLNSKTIDSELLLPKRTRDSYIFYLAILGTCSALIPVMSFK
jgi:hypothetical protein